MKLEEAQNVAAQLVTFMSTYCVRIEIAGSIRRQVPTIKDIELVLIPKWDEWPKEGSLLDEKEPVNVLHWAIARTEFIQWIKPGTPEIEPWKIEPQGKYWRGLIKTGRFDSPQDIKLDVFLVRPTNWGVLYTIRTGSATFSQALVTYIKHQTPLRVQDGDLIRKADGSVIPCPEEIDLFEHVGLKWIEPQWRHDGRALCRKQS
jgi:DNA polymerase/3'-5' exonuclease PolX